MAATSWGGTVVLRSEKTNTLVQIKGDSNDDWRLQSSSNWLVWSNMTNFGTLISGHTNAPWRSVGYHTNSQRYYRALKTDGLYDTSLMRTFSLTFTQANVSNLLALARTHGTNVYCSLLTLENGATNTGVGARFRGNTSFTGVGGGGGPGGPGASAPVKKSLAIEINYPNTNADLMGYDHLNLNNAYLDYTIMRESLYFNLMRKYTVCPRCCLARLYVNGANWGVYSCAQQEDGSLIKDYFPSNNGDRWRAPNMGGGGTASASSAFTYLGSAISSYTSNYELKTDYTNALGYTNAWLRLIHACDVLNNTATNLLRDKVEDVLAVDRWLWFLAIENLVTDEDSYYYKGADYAFYYEPESGRIHPIEHDGNESSVMADYTLSPVTGETSSSRPLLQRLLSIPELRQRYLAHMRTVLQESFHPTNLVPRINEYAALSAGAIAADPMKGFTMATYTNDLASLRTFVTNRYSYLTNHAELRPMPPTIVAVYAPTSGLTAGQIPIITAKVQAYTTNGLSSVWLYFRDKPYGRFTCVQMFDDGTHGDGVAGDGVFGAPTTNYPAGNKIHYYVEARSANSARAASFSPPRAEENTHSYRVALATALNSPVVINELMAANSTTLADPQGEYDDWIELHNVTDAEVDLSGRYLSDEPHNPRKWQFPAGTKIGANGYLIVWADENGSAPTGLHASFKLDKSGEQLFLLDTDANLNAVLDWVNFGAQEADRSYGRSAYDADVWTIMDPTPGQPNR